MTMNATVAALTVAEQNGKILESLIYSKAIITVALDALAGCADADAANRLLVKACQDIAKIVDLDQFQNTQKTEK